MHTAASFQFSAIPGVVPNMSGKTPLDFFHLFIDEKVKEIIYNKTSQNAEQHISENQEYLSSHPHARAHDWVKAPMWTLTLHMVVVPGVRCSELGERQTKYRCKVCKVPLHLEDCFETYHTKLNYGQL